MSYNYSQMNDIIAKQYERKKNTRKDGSFDDNWFWEESIKFGKGYSKPGEYLQAIAKNALDRSNKNNQDVIVEDTALYLDEKR